NRRPEKPIQNRQPNLRDLAQTEHCPKKVELREAVALDPRLTRRCSAPFRVDILNRAEAPPTALRQILSQTFCDDAEAESLVQVNRFQPELVQGIGGQTILRNRIRRNAADQLEARASREVARSAARLSVECVLARCEKIER